MPNTHGTPDFAAELQAIMGENQSPSIVSTTWPVAPVSSLTLAAFATRGFVKDGANLVYVEQPAAPVTLSGADGVYWIGLHRNTSAAVPSWTRQAGTHYVWRSNPTHPADPAGGLVMTRVTVAGGIITVVDQVGIRVSPISLQDATALTISGVITVAESIGIGLGANLAFALATGVKPSFFNGTIQTTGLGVGIAPGAGAVTLTYPRAVSHGIKIVPSADTGPGVAVYFVNAADTVNVGSITTTGTTTAYNTSSDQRLKEAIEALEGALDTILALRPVSFTWQVDGSQGQGFLAHELQAVVPDAVVGVPDAVNPDGSIRPQQVDHSKLVVHLVGAVQELAARVTALEAAQP